MKNIVYLIRSRHSDSELGIIKKVLSQKEAFMDSGYNVHVFSFNRLDEINKVNGIEHIYIDKKNEKNNFFKKIYKNFSLIKKIINKIHKLNPDIIYIRDFLFFYNLHKQLSKIAPVFIEVQSNILSELKISDKKSYYIEKILKRYYLRNVSGVIGITNEIIQTELQFNKKPYFILGNGIDGEDIQFSYCNKNDNKINLLFIGTPNSPWHGVDRLVNSYLKSENRLKFKLNIVGYENNLNVIDDNISFYGIIKDENILKEIIAKSDIGVGTLELYKNKMEEAAPLKTRQYLAYGLPVIIAYNDVDLNEQLPFIMKVKNDNSLIDFNCIEKFWNTVKDYRVKGEISNFTKDNLSWYIKIRELIVFFESISE